MFDMLRRTKEDPGKKDRIKKQTTNIKRLQKYYKEGNIKGIGLQVRYLENAGIKVPANINECDMLIRQLNVE